MRNKPRWFLAGLFFTTLATLCLEVLDTRLLSVMAWYHLSFFAVSTAMFGMSAGALRVYLGGSAFEGEKAERSLVRHALVLALLTPLCHVANLVVRIPSGISGVTIAALLVSTLALAIPFYVSGVVVTIALTRSNMAVGRAYAVDLAGAALGSLCVIPLFAWSNLTTAVFACGAAAALGALCFAVRANGWGLRTSAVLVLASIGAAVLNANAAVPITVWYVKDRFVGAENIISEAWNVHSRVVLPRQRFDRPFYWGEGLGAGDYKVEAQPIGIDGDALTVMTRWSGDPAELEWVKHDVTSLPYHLRKGGDAAVIGVGGGRDVLTALWARSSSVTGVELNGILLRYLRGDWREFTHIADRPEVTLVHDEARSHLTRTDKRFDVLQMSLIDTWAATAAGGFTLTENGLYTLDAWRVFLRVLKPHGILSVSRWYDPAKVSETTRLLALGTAALLERGVADPSRCLVLAARGGVSTLLISNEPFSVGPIGPGGDLPPGATGGADDGAGAESDIGRIRAACERYGFELLAAPGVESRTPLFDAVLRSRTRADLDLAVADDTYDFTPPTDERPFFFNILKPSRAFTMKADEKSGGVQRGNLQATSTLLVLALISLVLVTGVIFGPLAASGLPRMERTSFALAVAWFAAIGLGFMLVQIPLMQRFSVYLGHPTYAIVAVLSTMILAAGAGSLLSDRVRVEESPAKLARLPLLAAVAILATALLSSVVVARTIEFGLVARCALTVAVIAPTALVLGLFFPIGMRLVRRISPDATAWMWGVNGACGVLGAVIAVAISMWAGIGANLLVALALYASLAVVAPALHGRAPGRLRAPGI